MQPSFGLLVSLSNAEVLRNEGPKPVMQEAKPGNKVGVRHKGWLAKTNKVFDQTKGSKTFNFRVGMTPLCAVLS